MISTPDLYQLVRLADTQRWQLVLAGDHRQLQAVGRRGLFAEFCLNPAELADATRRLRTAVPSDPTGQLRQPCKLAGLVNPMSPRIGRASCTAASVGPSIGL